ncbi:TetR/AcrR family transcriptional regulator [Oceanobacillus halotolerans]|uniref:TetR/AcrR family transcriptional regulator n=1 Tax=Oceanobacillus halotolerans TaxID=2663380 RepID=UPI00299E8271|nr:TetR/AcrR family transcriptional regulator [Oceanobacillus halotolerans]
MQSALVLFEQHGYHGVSVNDIVENVGTSKGGFYHHFTSKDELLFVIHDAFISYALEKATIATNTYQTPTKKLQAIVNDFVKVFDLYKSHIAVFYQESNYLQPKYKKLIKRKRDQFKNIIIAVIDEGKKRGEFRRDIPTDITSMAILGMVNWTYKWFKRDGSKTIDEISDVYIDLLLHAILSETAYPRKHMLGL